VYKKAKLSKQNLERERKELEKLAIREKTLASSIDYLKTDQGIEDEIRTKFRAVKDGEKVVVIIDNQSTTTIPENKQASSTSFWYNLFHW
jgi:cell division protein FtsB